MKKALCGLLALATLGSGTFMLTFKFYKLPSGSMLPNLKPGDMFLVSRFAYRFGLGKPARGDIVVFRVPGTQSRELVKRIVGLAGDTVAVGKKRVLLNGKRLPRRAVPGPCSYLSDGKPQGCVAYDETVDGKTYRIIHDATSPAMNGKRVKVPEGFVYVLGDNRDNSYDSRAFGPIVAGSIRGKVWK